MAKRQQRNSGGHGQAAVDPNELREPGQQDAGAVGFGLNEEKSTALETESGGTGELTEEEMDRDEENGRFPAEVNFRPAKPPEPPTPHEQLKAALKNVTGVDMTDSPRARSQTDAEAAAVSVLLPMCVGEVDSSRHGYVSARIDLDLGSGEMAKMFKRLLVGLRASHATYVHQTRVVHVDSANDVVRWLMSQLAEAEKQ